MSDITAGQIQIHNSLHLLGIVILYYDHLITFDLEYRHVWHRWRTGASWFFFLNRYFAFFANIVVNVGNFTNFLSEKSCSRYALYRQIVLMVSGIIVCVILFLRTWALYGRDRRILVLILSVGCILAALACWSVVGQKSDVSFSDGCHIGSSHISAIHIAVAWEVLFVYDIMIVTLTLSRTYKEQFRRPLAASRRHDLVGLIVRDGAIYFAVMACANFANTLTFYILAPALRGCLSTFASAISVSMMSRLMLNLHSSAAGTLHRYTSTTEPSTAAGSATTTSMLFTSRIPAPSATTLAQGRSVSFSAGGTSTATTAYPSFSSDRVHVSLPAPDVGDVEEPEEIELVEMESGGAQTGAPDGASCTQA